MLIKAFKKSRWLYTSDYVLNEVLSLVYSRTGNTKLVLELDRYLQESGKLNILKVDAESLTDAKFYLREYIELIPNLTDWTILVMLRSRKNPAILSFDAHFKRAKTIKEFSRIKCISSAREL